MFFRRPFYVPTRVQSKQAEMPMQRLLTEGEMHPNNMAVFPVGKTARGTANNTVQMNGTNKSATCPASISKCQPFEKRRLRYLLPLLARKLGCMAGVTTQNKTWFSPVSQSASCATARRYGYSATRLWSAYAAAFS